MQRIDRFLRSARVFSTRLRRALPMACGRLVDLLYPPQCAWCKSEMAESHDDIALCEPCRRQFAPPAPAWCRRCSAVLSDGFHAGDSCVHCQGRRFLWERVFAMGNYRGELRRAIWETKRPHGEPLAQSLGRLLFDRCGDDLRSLGADAIVPIPMHWRRRLRRGTNGPDLIAAALANRLDLPLRVGALARRRTTPLQAESTPALRRVNQRRSFRVPAGYNFKNRRILVVDDVLTTGATCNEAARTLLSAGAASVVVAVIARAVGDDVL